MTNKLFYVIVLADNSAHYIYKENAEDKYADEYVARLKKEIKERG